MTQEAEAEGKWRLSSKSEVEAEAEGKRKLFASTSLILLSYYLDVLHIFWPYIIN